MPIDARWLVKDHVAYHKYMGRITLDECIYAAELSLRMMSASEHPIHVLIDCGDIQSFPTQMTPLVKAVNRCHVHPNMGWVISYQIKNNFVRTLSKIIIFTAQAKHSIVDNYTDAIVQLQQVVPNLPDLSTIEPSELSTFCHIEGDQMDLSSPQIETYMQTL